MLILLSSLHRLMTRRKHQQGIFGTIRATTTISLLLTTTTTSLPFSIGIALQRYSTTMVANALSQQPRRNIHKRRLVWHRNRDLRFHDHPFYSTNESAPNNADGVEPSAISTTTTTSFFCFDDDFGCGIRNSVAVPHSKMVHLGPHGMRVLLESVRDLRWQSETNQRLNLSQPFILRRGPTVPALVDLLGAMVKRDIKDEEQKDSCDCYWYEVCWHEEPGWEEQELSKKVESALQGEFERLSRKFSNQQLRFSTHTDVSCTLYHPNDLPQPGEWRPLTKKELRRKENQQKRAKQLLQKKPKVSNSQPSSSLKSPQGAKDASKSTSTSTNSPNSLAVNVSLERWESMPRIMGDFRKIAREKAGIRPCLETTQEPAATDLPEEQIYSIDKGKLPTLEELLEPLLTYLEKEKDNSVLGLPPGVVRDVCDHALQIYHQNTVWWETTQQRANNNSDQNTKDWSRLVPPEGMGGETVGLWHLHDFCNENHLFCAQRNLACVDNYQSSRLSHHLAFGTLSPRQIVASAQAVVDKRKNDDANVSDKDEEENKKKQQNNDGTWLISHMTMRDFFLYTCFAAGPKFYRLEGIPVSQKVASSISWKPLGKNTKDGREDSANSLWSAWAIGTTGLPLVDATMTEMIQTGYASNRVRQNAASVLTKDLEIDWRAGAEWFQFLLADHCVGANWGNWLYFSGVGPDPKNRHFCTVSQAYKYDPNGEYVRKWIPALNQHDNDIERCLRPWDFDPSWKRPIVDPESQYTWRDLQRLQETGSLAVDTSNSNA